MAVERRLLGASVSPHASPGAVHHAGDGQLVDGDGCGLRQLGQRLTDVTVLYTNNTNHQLYTAQIHSEQLHADTQDNNRVRDAKLKLL